MTGVSSVEMERREGTRTGEHVTGGAWEVEDRPWGAGTTAQSQGKELTRGRREDNSAWPRKQLKEGRGSGWHCWGEMYPVAR